MSRHTRSKKSPLAHGPRKGPMVPGRPAAGGPKMGPMVPGARAHGMAGAPRKGPMVPGPRSYGMAGNRQQQLQRTHVPSQRPGHPVAGGVPSVRPGHPTGVFAAAAKTRTGRGRGGGVAGAKKECPPGYVRCATGHCAQPGQCPSFVKRGHGIKVRGGGLDARSAVKLKIAADRKRKGKKRGRSIASGCIRNVNNASFPCQGRM